MRKTLRIGLFLLPGFLGEASAADSTASLGAQIQATIEAIHRTAADIFRLRRELAARSNSVAPAPGRGGASGGSTAPAAPGSRGNSAPASTPVAGNAPGGTPTPSNAISDGDGTSQEVLDDVELAFASLEQSIELLYNQLVLSLKALEELKRKIKELERLESLTLSKPSSMFALLVEYQRIVQREAEAEQELARAKEELKLLQREAKLDVDAVPQSGVIKKTGPRPRLR